MSYNEKLAGFIRELLQDAPGLQEKKMFGGVGFLVQGNMAVGIYQDDLIVRLPSEAFEQALSMPFTRPMDITGKPMRGWVMVSHDGYVQPGDLNDWVQQGVNFARTLPPK